jgi:trimethylamine--corrinoid protein Co-methyltransferase
MGATLAALAGINNISGPGMLDFESCMSLEKLVVDNEIAGITQRMIRGVEPREDFPALPRFEELLAEKHLLISKHTRKHLKDEHYFCGPAIDRANLSRWREEGGRTLGERAHAEVERLIGEHRPSGLSDEVKAEMTRLMEAEARRHGMDSLPHTSL